VGFMVCGCVCMGYAMCGCMYVWVFRQLCGCSLNICTCNYCIFVLFRLGIFILICY